MSTSREVCEVSARRPCSWAHCSCHTLPYSIVTLCISLTRPPCDVLRHTPPLISDFGAVEEGVNSLTMLIHRLSK